MRRKARCRSALEKIGFIMRMNATLMAALDVCTSGGNVHGQPSAWPLSRQPPPFGQRSAFHNALPFLGRLTSRDQAAAAPTLRCGCPMDLSGKP